MESRRFVHATVVLLVVIAVLCGVIFLAYFVIWPTPSSRVANGGKPNIIILLADDTGYGDFQTYGHPTQEWTAVDRMAKEGIKFTHWSSPASVCSPSRAALLTGRYPIRSGIFGKNTVFMDGSIGGLPHREITIAEALRDVGYATGMVGKWHLGINKKNSTDGKNLPMHHGFEYVGINLPYTQLWFCDPKKYNIAQMRSCFVYQNDKIIEQPIKFETLTARLVDDTKEFIDNNKHHPFFFLLSFPQTHAALFSDPRFAQTSKRGRYGDSVNEMGWAIGQVLDQLKYLGIDEDTLVLFLSDQGPMVDGCGEAGDAGVFRGGKATMWEGGVRVPAVAWWPGTISPGTVSHATISTMDILPTALKLAGAEDYLEERKIAIDGKVINDVVKTDTTESFHEALFYYCSDILMSARYKKYKIHYYTVDPMVSGIVSEGGGRCEYSNRTKLFNIFSCEHRAKKQDPPLIFNYEADPQEQISLDATTKENQILLDIIADLVQTHKASIIPVQSEIDKPYYRSITPCCNPPACTCNYK
ncbi:arylsulfatase-like isoform X1 [Styela clava]